MSDMSLEQIEEIARRTVYRELYHALQLILDGGATKEHAERLLVDACSNVIGDKNGDISAFLNDNKYPESQEDPFKSKTAIIKYILERTPI